MIVLDNEYKEALKHDKNYSLLERILDESNNALIDVPKEKILGYSISSATDETFGFGGAVMKQHNLMIDNSDGAFNDVELEGMSIASYLGLSGRTNMSKGRFIINKAIEAGDRISIESYDYMIFFDSPYECKLKLPVTVKALLDDIVTRCCMSYDYASIPNPELKIHSLPDQSTCRDIIGWLAQIMGCYAYVDRLYTSMLKFGFFYNGNYSEELLDGLNHHEFTSDDMYSFKRNKKDMIINSVCITIGEQDKQMYVRGEDGYKIDIKDNPLISKENVNEVLDALYAKVQGFPVRVFEASVPCDFTIEAGDVVFLTDSKKGETIKSVITSCEFNLFGTNNISCSAQTETENAHETSTVSSRIIQSTKKIVDNEISAYDVAMQDLVDLMGQGLGVYKTAETNEDGSKIFYFHNSPSLSESQVRWKITANGIAVSNDYGETYTAGISAAGTMLAQMLQVVGIQFDWAKGGELTLGGKGNGNGILTLLSEDGATLATLTKDGLITDGATIKGASGEFTKSFFVDTVHNFFGTQYRSKISSNNGIFNVELKNDVDDIALGFLRLALGYLALYGKGNVNISSDNNINLSGKDINITRGSVVLENDSALKSHTVADVFHDDGTDVIVIYWTSGNNVYVGDYKGANLNYLQGTQAEIEEKLKHRANNCFIIADNTYLGGSSGVAVTSDRRYKTDFKKIQNAKEFIMSLAPCSYKYNPNGRNHFGFIAQDVETVLSGTVGDAGILVKRPLNDNIEVNLNDDSTYVNSLRYEEFIAPIVQVIQEQEERLEEQEKRLEKLEAIIFELEEKNANT